MKFRVAAAIVVGFGLAVPAAAPANADDNGLAGAIHTLRKEGKRLCMDGHYHSGNSSGAKDKKLAMAEAIKSWAGFTAFEYGTDWANWNKAANKSANCSQGASGWGCSIEARPCK